MTLDDPVTIPECGIARPSIPAVGDHLTIDVRSKRFPARGDAPARTVLKDLRLELKPGRFHAIVGPSGCGKTTLLNIVAGLDRDFDGSVTLPGGRRAVLGYVFQGPRLLPWRTVAENLELVLHDKADGRERAARWLREVGMEDHGAAYPQRLSVGMSRRVALARAFAVEPDLLLMDEPFVSLDEPTARHLRHLLMRIRRTRPSTVPPATVLFVTHDLREAVTLADRVLFLSRPPARVLLELPIGLTPEERLDERRVDALWADLRHDHATTLEGVP